MLRSENPDFVVKEKKEKKVGLEDQLKRKSLDGKKGRGPAKKLVRSAISDIQEELSEAEDEEEPEEDDDSVEEEVSVLHLLVEHHLLRHRLLLPLCRSENL